MDLAGPREGVLVGRKSPYPAEFRSDAVALYRAMCPTASTRQQIPCQENAVPLEGMPSKERTTVALARFIVGR
jgi:hypothetical protein